jgi:hypothetical protein
MIVKHSIESTTDESDAMYSMVTGICLAEYPTVEAQTAAIMAAKDSFKVALDVLIDTAFTYGQKIGKSKADKTDTAMYRD